MAPTVPRHSLLSFLSMAVISSSNISPPPPSNAQCGVTPSGYLFLPIPTRLVMMTLGPSKLHTDGHLSKVRGTGTGPDTIVLAKQVSAERGDNEVKRLGSSFATCMMAISTTARHSTLRNSAASDVCHPLLRPHCMVFGIKPMSEGRIERTSIPAISSNSNPHYSTKRRRWLASSLSDNLACQYMSLQSCSVGNGIYRLSMPFCFPCALSPSTLS